MSESVSAHDAALMPSTSGSLLESADRTKAMTWVSQLETLGKHGTHRAVDLPAGEHFALTHAAFAFDEAAGETSAGVGVFAVVNGEREEIDAFARVGIGGRGGEHNVIAHADHGRSMGLLGQFSGFK